VNRENICVNVEAGVKPFYTGGQNESHRSLVLPFSPVSKSVLNLLFLALENSERTCLLSYSSGMKKDLGIAWPPVQGLAEV
jgi:hypothetical protein